jgi:hypothetical protein
MQNSKGNVPLHLACWQNQLFNNIQLLVESCPMALKCKNKRKETPVHLACSRQASFNILECLMRKDPVILGWQDCEGLLPLHSIFEHYPLNKVIGLMRLHMPLLPQLLKMKSRWGETLEIFCDSDYPNFTERAIRLLEEEFAVGETLNWMNVVAQSLQSLETIPEASIVLEWTRNYKKNCHEKLTLIQSALNDLVATYPQRMVY